MDANAKVNHRDDRDYRAMFNIPEPGTEPSFGILGGPVILLSAILIPLAIFGGIDYLLN